MTVILDANPNTLSIGAYDSGPYAHQIQPPIDFYQSGVPRPGGGTWQTTDFMKVVAAPWNAGSEKAWMVTIFPAVGCTTRERSELLLLGNRADLSAAVYNYFKNWTDDSRNPSSNPKLYCAQRRVFGDATYPWNGPIGGAVILQVKTMGYDDPAVAGTSETINFTQQPVFDICPRGNDWIVDIQGGIISLPSPGYVSGRRNAWARTAGTFISGHVYDIIAEVTASLGQITAKNAPLPATQGGGCRVWIRDWTVDQSDWNDAAHLVFDSFNQDASPGFDYIPAAHVPRALGAIEGWNYPGSTENYPNTSQPVAPALTAGHLPPQHFTGRGVYRGGWVNGERSVHRSYVGKERICTTLSEAQALYGTGTPGGSAPAYTVAPTLTGTAQEGSNLTYAQGTASGSPTYGATLQGYDTQWRDLATVTPGTITLADQHVGLKLRVKEVATNAYGSTISFTAVTLPISRSDANWIANPGAESSTLGVASNIGTEVVTQDATNVDTGSHAIKCVTAGNTAFEGIFGPIWGAEAQAIFVPAGQSRTYAVRSKIPSGVQMRLACNYFDSGYKLIQSASKLVVGTGAYATYTLDVPAIGVDSAHQVELTTGSAGSSLASQTFYADSRTLSDVVTTSVGISLVGSVVTKAQIATSWSQSFTVPAGVANGLLVIVQAYDDFSRPIGPGASAPTWGANAATLLQKPSVAAGGNVEWWVIENPPAGTNSVAYSHTSQVAGVLAIYLLQGVDQATLTSLIATPVKSNTATHPTLSIATTVTDFVIGACVFSATSTTTLSQDSGPTTRYNTKEFSGFGIHGAGATYAGDGSAKTFGWFEANAGAGQPSVLTAVAFKAAGPPPPPTNTSLPVITGTVAQDNTVSVSDGGWQAGASAPVSFSYQYLSAPSATGPWQPIDGAIQAQYRPTADVVGKWLVADVTAYDAGGSTKARSVAVGPVTVTYPIWDASPNLYGPNDPPRVGDTLTVDNGLTENSPTSYVKQWRRNAGTPGSSFSDMAGVLGDNYVLQPADEHYEFEVRVTAENDTGSADATSNTLGPVEPQIAVVDSGNGPDQNPLPAPFLRVQSDTYHVQRLGNQFASAAPGTNVAQAVLSTISLEDMEITIRVPVLPGAGGGVGIRLRTQNAEDATQAAGYAFDYFVGTGFQLYVMTAGGSYAQLGTTVSPHALAPFEYLVARISGTTIDTWWKGVDGVRHSVFSGIEDGTVTGLGCGGFELNDSVGRIDNVDVQPVTVHPIYTTQRRIYIPANYDGTDLRVEQTGYGADSDKQVNMAVRDDWQRVPVNFQPTISLAGAISVVEKGLPPTDGRFVYVDGMQTEQAPIATPFRLTSSGAGRVQAESDIADEATFGVVFRISYGFSSEDNLDSDAGLFDWRDDADNRLSLYLQGGSKEWVFERFSSGVGTHVISDAQVFADGVEATIAAQATPSGLMVSVNGAPYISAANANIPALAASLLDIGGLDGENQGNVRIKYAAWMHGTLSDLDVANLHSILESGRKPLLGNFPTSANITAIMPMIDDTFYKPL